MTTSQYLAEMQGQFAPPPPMPQMFQPDQQFGGKGQGKGDQPMTGLTETLRECMKPALRESMKLAADQDPSAILEDMVKTVQNHVMTAATKYENDSRCVLKRGWSVDAEAMMEEFVSAILSSLAITCSNKPWFSTTDFTPAFLVAAIHTFKDTMLFVRTLGPSLKRYIDNGVFRYREEARMQKVMMEAVVASGLGGAHHRAACENLRSSYNEAFMAAQYGSSRAWSPEEGVLLDFVKCWMMGFVLKSHGFLTGGVAGGSAQAIFLLVRIFHYLTDPSRTILPQELSRKLANPPAANWNRVEELAEAVMKEIEQSPNKKQRLGMP